MGAVRFGIRIKLILLLLPFVTGVVVLSGYISTLESRTAMMRIANRHLAEKTEDLRDYLFNEWQIVSNLKLSEQPEYINAMKESVRSFATSLLTTETEEIIVFTGDGTLEMFVSLHLPESVIRDSTSPTADSFMKSGLTIYSQNEQKRIGIVFDFEPFNWTVVFSELYTEFFREIENIQKKNGWILLGALAVISILIPMYIGRIISPIERLSDMIEQITSTGDLSTRISIPSKDEIELLANRFNTMLYTIEQEHEKLEEQRKSEQEARKLAQQQEKEALHLLGKISDLRDEDTGEHLKRIGALSKMIAEIYGLDSLEQDILINSAPLHDIGKIGVPDSVLLKPGKLTNEEFEIIKHHTVLGHTLLKDSQSRYLREGALIAYTHHEKWNGKGYPCGLAGKDIPLNGRIVSIVDVLDALLSERPYKKPWPPEKVQTLMLKEKGGHFDPDLAEIVYKNFDLFLKLYT